MKTVLVIDDDAGFRLMVGTMLRQEGWEVLEAEEGDLGLELARVRRPGFILCDLLMPGCNGFQVCRALRSEASMRSTRIIVTSGRDFESDRQAARAAGADDYIAKPIEPTMLLEVLSRFSRGESASVQPRPAAPVATAAAAPCSLR